MCQPAFDGSDGLSSEEEEQRGVAKRKMLGNIRFVGKCSSHCQTLLPCAAPPPQESCSRLVSSMRPLSTAASKRCALTRTVAVIIYYLHYVQLLERRRGTSVTDMAENVECLCHFMTTVGEKLDTLRAKV